MSGIEQIPGAIRAIGPLAQPDAPGEAATSPAFRRMLERLEALSHTEPAAVDDPASLTDAMRSAEDTFSLAMDLRRRLEDAWAQRAGAGGTPGQ